MKRKYERGNSKKLLFLAPGVFLRSPSLFSRKRSLKSFPFFTKVIEVALEVALPKET
jgi:hypothetical protein